MNLRAKTIIGYDKSILEEATRTTPNYGTCISHTQRLTGVQELHGKNISGVHMPYSADWLQVG